MKKNAPVSPDFENAGMSKEALKTALSEHLTYSISKYPVTATDRDWFEAAAFAVRDRLVERWKKTQAAYDANLARLRDWLATRPDLEVAGEPSAVYWDSPFVPGFLKRSEVHIPVRKRAS